ncbi:hypothetical protein EZJ55_13080 [Microcystis aeruginosa EAWAG127a]|uniref:Uncharacterized protein n=1 Tax=Microcystis aeruginosa EAWAG127a TaxID=2529855 RepID=A0A5J5M081_MICAE|nr:hypothetical protein EZJ55_13080 [Microcystis aeruginosa EAWAG127a]
MNYTYLTPSCLLPLAFCLLPFASCLLPLAFCLLPFASCLLPIFTRKLILHDYLSVNSYQRAGLITDNW